MCLSHAGCVSHTLGVCQPHAQCSTMSDPEIPPRSAGLLDQIGDALREFVSPQRAAPIPPTPSDTPDNASVLDAGNVNGSADVCASAGTEVRGVFEPPHAARPIGPRARDPCSAPPSSLPSIAVPSSASVPAPALSSSSARPIPSSASDSYGTAQFSDSSFDPSSIALASHDPPSSLPLDRPTASPTSLTVAEPIR